MEKIQVRLRKEEVVALRQAARRSGRSIGELVRDAVRKTIIMPHTRGPVAIWDGEIKQISMDPR